MIEARVRGLTAVLDAAVGGLLGVDVEVVQALELAGLRTDMETQRRWLESVEVRVVAALSAPAQRSLDLAPRRTLSGEALDPIHPRTAAALAGGEISGAHVDVITSPRSTSRSPGERRTGATGRSRLAINR